MNMAPPSVRVASVRARRALRRKVLRRERSSGRGNAQRHFGFAILDFGLGARRRGNAESKIHNPKSTIVRLRRAGLTPPPWELSASRTVIRTPDVTGHSA